MTSLAALLVVITPSDVPSAAVLVPTAGRLRMLCTMADAIVVAKVEERFRQAHSPYESNCQEQHTVVRLKVLQKVKAPSEGVPAAIKVSQPGGDLPWVEDGVEGAGWRLEGQPLLQKGETYLLFLQIPVKQNPALLRKGYLEAGEEGRSGRSGELDEWWIASPPRGQLLVKDGRLVLPSEPGWVPPKPWTFDPGQTPRTLLGLTLQEAVAKIEAAMEEERLEGTDPKRQAELRRQEAMAGNPIPAHSSSP